MDAYRGKLAGKILILDRNDIYELSFSPDARRYTDEQLDLMANPGKMQHADAVQPADTAVINKRRELLIIQVSRQSLFNALKSLAASEGAIAVFTTSPRNHDGTIFVQQAGPYKVTDPANFLDIALQWEDYMTIVRLLKIYVPVKWM